MNFFLFNLGFKKCQIDCSTCYLALYVDDLLIFNKETTVVKKVKKSLSREFEMKDLRDLVFFLGIQVARDWNHKTIMLGQLKYISEILK
jgi:hypothetical protein